MAHFQYGTSIVEDSKRALHIAFKGTKDLLQGYTFAYARQQILDQSHGYSNLWCESITPIPDRGTTDIRKNRILNLQRAADKIHQLQIGPQKIFSFCDRVGNPTLRNGFHAGAVFIGGQVKTGVGGGLCLIATNLFHLFLNSGCQILERHCHSIDAYGQDRFYELGQDATVAYGYKDLIVRNQSAIPLLLKLCVLPDTGQVISSLWGQAPCPWQVKVSSVVLQELPSPFEKGISGWKVKTQRVVRAQPDEMRVNFETKEKAVRPWHLDYHSISLYKPCIDSNPNPVVAEKQLG